MLVGSVFVISLNSRLETRNSKLSLSLVCLIHNSVAPRVIIHSLRPLTTEGLHRYGVVLFPWFPGYLKIQIFG